MEKNRRKAYLLAEKGTESLSLLLNEDSSFQLGESVLLFFFFLAYNLSLGSNVQS
jgi:hypothetical protein